MCDRFYGAGHFCTSVREQPFADISQKQLSNEMKSEKKISHIGHPDVCNAAYSKSYRASCFKQVKHLQNLSVKNSISQELKYT